MLSRIPVRLRRFMSVGALLTIINGGLLILLVDGGGVSPTIANVGRTIVMTQVQFALHRYHTWKDKRDDCSFWQQWRRHHYLRSGTIILSQLLFWLLVTQITLHYMIAYCICSMTIGAIHYTVGDRFVFATKA